METFAREKQIVLPANLRAALAERYAAFRADDEETLGAIRRVHAETGRLIDPHTAVAVAAAEKLRVPAGAPVVVLSTAHPAKFPDAVQRATGQIPPLPPRLRDLMDRPEKMTVLPPDKSLVRDFIAVRVPHHEY
jgi:threonine synthase